MIKAVIKSVIRKREVHGPGRSWLAFPHILLIAGLLLSPSTTNADVPSAPSLHSPPNGSSVCDTMPYFEWLPVNGVDSYHIQVGNNSNFSSLEIEDRTPNPYYTPGTPLSPGTYYWHVGTGDGSWSSTWSFIIPPTPSAPSLSSPSSGGSTCNATPYFAWSQVNGADLYHIQIDDNSNFSSPEKEDTTLNPYYTPGVPLSPGTYYWHVRASNSCEDGPYSSTWSFTILSTPSAPSLSSPSNSSSTCNTTPDFAWSSVSGATSYRIEVDDNSGFDSPEIDTTTSNSNYTPGSPLSPGTYYWHVRASNPCEDGHWSSTWSFTILSTPSATSPSLPSNGGSTCDATPDFAWSPVSGAASYHIQVDDDPSFSSPEIDTPTSTPYYTPESALSPGTYYWHVRASNSCGDGPWSSVWTITILPIPSAPSLSSPSNGSTISDTTPTFMWDSVSGAISYTIQVDDNSGFNSPEIDQTTSSTSYTPGSALPDGTYYWRAQASNACGTGSWATVWQFTVDTGCPTPPTPSLSVPANGSSTCDTTPTFSWGSVSEATPYRIQVGDDSSFSSPEIDTTTSNTNHTPGSALSPGTYYWQVQASNSCGDSPWSSVWSVTILSTPSAPSPSSPPNRSTISDTIPTFRWGSVSGATSYSIQVDDNSAISSPTTQIISSTSYTPDSALPDGTTYYWQVRASNSCGSGPWSAMWEFTTSAQSPPEFRIYLPAVVRGYPS